MAALNSLGKTGYLLNVLLITAVKPLTNILSRTVGAHGSALSCFNKGFPNALPCAPTVGFRQCRVLSVIWLLIAAVYLLTPYAANATTLSEILTGMKSARIPASMENVSFDGQQDLDLVEGQAGFLPEGAVLFAAWRLPDDWVCTYEVSGDTYSGTGGLDAHPAVDHVFFARPDFVDFLELEWTPQYQGSANWNGEPAYSLVFRPMDLTLSTPRFTMYVSKDKMVPLRTEVEFSDGSVGITDFTWVTVDGIFVPSSFDSDFIPSIGPLEGYTSTFYNHSVNGDLSGVSFPGVSGIITADTSGENDDGDDSQSGFDSLYHGFDNDPIIASINDSDGNFDRIEFSFTLDVNDRDVFLSLDGMQDELRDVASGVISQWDWSGMSGLGSIGGKYQCGSDIRSAINEYLSTDAITDFYFIVFEPLAPGE